MSNIFWFRFPWESVFTGAEAAPKREYQFSQFAQHVTAGVGNAVRSIFFATNDQQWMKDYGCDLAIGTAQFWASRVAFNESANRYDINGVMGPDEDHFNVNNNPFTNVAVALNLFFGTFVTSFSLDFAFLILMWPITLRIMFSSDTRHAFARN